ncbi:putative GTPase [Arabidopsis thaliana]|jgi:nuclear GTP-binding protein|uniref:Guanine nucleotide-binding protein-like NSN1 n=5 Tax=Arabidopsis TaxID=3701 RepID=NSN1_ARATH|nr:GTP-binding family protein [Arabidopsis thaliana]Q9M8Z5.1 RecName: Full=Guanine nucleotide-binding protein-like NSN1; Short=Nucleolar GTP-binding protein NSN1; AltName: Full=DAR GTPase 4; AltName: Full=Protein nucleostemin-like 1 [Arabidopsis thaliana]KAG7624348.1 P-loop containing nucleoside triphosphate hydrolase [Arabidopsis thaliana x Arabidopsis arenosa]KAG7630361.1 Guanine nucleotide-binding protein-like 3 N-terminal domain [Arabidopsis suecica]AAF27009.1 putative GTPase [Arabidopsis t|eukprot:NP_187361.1 GTP-binding family protein [Arabidopsis thaliana]
MVKRSKKSKSKRVTLKQKHKVLKKVKEHHKKKAKDAKKLGLHRKPRVEKDPGIPNDWPFKEQELKALEVRRARALEEIEQKKEARKERAKKRKLGLVDDEDTKTEGETIEDLPKVVNVRDNSERAFYKELVKVIELSDVILEVLDARDPLGTRCTDMERMVMQAGPNKHLVLLLNKIDLVPREAAEKWLMYLREEFPAVAFKCSTQEQRSNLGWKSSKASKPSNMLQTSDCLGADTLIKLLKNYSRSHELKKSITVGIIGLPNVGKSSLINSLKRAHVVNVGATPGLTRSLQEVHLDKNVKLLDCPGVVMLKSSGNDASIALRNCKRIEKLDDPVSPVKEILKLCPKDMLVTLYKIPSFEAVDDFLYKVATVRGKLKKGGLVDIDAAARIVLHDWNEGKIPYYTMPPKRDQGGHAESKIVTELAKDFNIDEVYSGESSFIGSLKTVNEFNPVIIPSNGPLNFDETMIEDESKTQTEEEAEHESDDDESMGGEEEEEAGKTKEKSETGRQNVKLYAAESMLNTKKQKAEKKKRKKAKKAGADEEDLMDGDYDFKVDYRKNKDGEDEEFQIDAKIPMAGLLPEE